MLGFKKKGGPTRPFSHATHCKILKADPGVEIPWQEIETGLGSRSACAGRSTIASRSLMAVSGSTRSTRRPSATRQRAISGT